MLDKAGTKGRAKERRTKPESALSPQFSLLPHFD